MFMRLSWRLYASSLNDWTNVSEFWKFKNTTLLAQVTMLDLEKSNTFWIQYCTKPRTIMKTEPVTAVAKTAKKRSVAAAKRKAERLKTDLPTVKQLETEVASSSSYAAPQEQAYMKEYLRMFKALKLMCRKSEAACLKSGQSRDYYAFCTLLSQQREVIADIRSISDLSQQVSILDENVLQPMIRGIGQNILDSFYKLRKLITETSEAKQTQFALAQQQELMRDQSLLLQKHYVKAVEQMTEALTGKSS